MFQYTPYTLPLALTMIVSAAAAVVVYRGGTSSAEVWGAVVQVALVLWAGVHVVVLSGASYESKLYPFLLFPAVAALLVTSLFGFTVHYTGRGHWLSRRRCTLLLAFSVVVLLTSVTNGAHELVFVDPHLDASGSFLRLAYGLGPAFYVFTAVEYVIIAGYLSLLFLKVLRSRNVYRRISLVLFASIAVLTGATVVSVAGRSPFPHFTLMPFAYLFFGVVLLLTTVSTGFVRALPVDRLLALVGSDVTALARDFVVEEIDNGIVVLDTDGRIVDINGTGKKMLGVDRAVGKRVFDVVPVDRIVEADDLADVLEKEESAEFDELHDEIWVDTPIGERCYDVQITALTDGSGNFAGRVVLLHDLTEQKRREEALRERVLELERQKESLETQTAQLEHQNERLDRFAGIVSHDLRNPLNVAQGHLRNVSDDLGDGDAVTVDAGTVEALEASHDRMQAIIDDALTLARQGKAITDTERVTLSTVAEEAWRNVDTAGSTLALAGDREVDADRDRLLTLFENLFRNAVEHGSTSSRSGTDDAVEHGSTESGSQGSAERDRGGVTVRVGPLEGGERSEAAGAASRTRRSDGGERAGGSRSQERSAAGGFYVEDDGPGIPEDERDEVLEHGYTTSADGTGFGLTIVSDVANAHGWRLDVTNGEAGGARFEIRGVGGE
jgi:PAS domain S-box-containing protein